jgi:hypothetical protein
MRVEYENEAEAVVHPMMRSTADEIRTVKEG